MEVATCIATCFGYEDPGDDGHGAFGDDNNNTHTIGVSLPIPILKESIGFNADLIHQHTVSVEIGGKTVHGIRITDAGPGEKGALIWDKSKNLGHILDLTYGTCQALGVRYNANNASYLAKFWIEDHEGNTIEIKGLEGPKHYV